MHDVTIIGAGPAGMMAALRARELGKSVLLLEKNAILGKKLLITGGGRCNIFHAEEDPRRLAERYGTKGKALLSAFSRFGMQATREFFESRGLPIVVQELKRAFPRSERAVDVRDFFAQALEQAGVEIRRDIHVTRVEKERDLITKIVHEDGEIDAQHVILATGGASHPETGSTGDAFPWLRTLGHTVHAPRPTLVPVKIRNPWIHGLAGLSLHDVRATIFDMRTRKKIIARTGKMLFTHTGLSGPLILGMSQDIGRAMSDRPIILTLDLFPSWDHQTLDQQLISVLEQGKNRLMKNQLSSLIAPRLLLALLDLVGIDPLTPCHQITRGLRSSFVQLCKAIDLTVTGLHGPEDAVVTDGGVDLTEIDFMTMRSKIVKNLSIIGDLLDFDRPSGGFSLQICWTTGWIAGTNC